MPAVCAATRACWRPRWPTPTTARRTGPAPLIGRGGSLDEASLARANELHELLHVRLALQFLGDPFEGLARVELRLDEEAVGLLERVDPLVGEPRALEADG